MNITHLDPCVMCVECDVYTYFHTLNTHHSPPTRVRGSQRIQTDHATLPPEPATRLRLPSTPLPNSQPTHQAKDSQ